MALALEEKYDQVRQLINMGKERGYLLYDEVNDILPAEVHSSEEIDDLLSTFERYGIDIYEDLAAAKAARATVDPAASDASSRSVAAFASLVRYMLTPVEATTAGRPASNPAAAISSRQDPPASKSTGTSRSQSGTP